MTIPGIRATRSTPSKPSRTRKAVAATAAASLAAVVIAVDSLPATAFGAGPAALHGTVTGAGKPLPSAQVTLFAGSREGTRELGHATTDATGSFTITYAPPTDGVLYVEAASAKASRLRLRSVVGVGAGGGVTQRSETTVTVNELTTVATTYSLAQFSDQHGIAGPSPGLQNAAATSFHLADPATGKPGKVVTNKDNGTTNETLATLGTLANLLSLCASPGAPHCDDVLRLATPPGGTTPQHTVQAVLNLVHNPTLAPAGLHALAHTANVFTPALDAPPTAWILALHYTETGLYSPGRIAFDAKGNAWASNNWQPGTRQPSPYVTVLDPAGHPTLGSPISGGGMKAGAWGIAIDHDGSAWVPSYGGDAISKYSATGTPLSPSTGWKNGNPNHPQGVAVDQKGNVWIANFYGLKGAPGQGNVIVYPHGDRSKAITITGGGLDHPFAVQIDGYGRAWVTNARLNGAKHLETRLPELAAAFGESGSVTVIGPDFKPTAFSPITGNSINFPLALAIDAENNAWVPDFLSNSITELRPDGTIAAAHKLPLPVGPWSVAIDGSDRVWVAGFGTPSVWLLCGENTTACPHGASTGTLLSPSQGFRNAAIQHLTAVQIDQSGNVWLANNWSKLLPPTGGVGLVELIGLATPVCTPLTPLPTRPSPATTNACPAQTATEPPTNSGTNPRTASSTGTYTVQPGDTLNSIATAHGKPWQALYERNKPTIGHDPNMILPGQTLTLG
ncbi:LysM peptidoglycan-binding domain-containing protein [Kitasatospora aureofaciens]|uniref:LysM peptidoglycan-binding domain-containing protein n=1 Tax=Kitasatospora aureofaciens TaxID=1894 RepID=UPI0037C82143